MLSLERRLKTFTFFFLSLKCNENINDDIQKAIYTRRILLTSRASITVPTPTVNAELGT